MNGLSLPVIHPSFQQLKRNGRLLHVVAAGLIIIHAISHLRQPDPSKIYLACLLLIAADILILAFLGRQALSQMPRLNLFFRGVECVFFMGIAVESFLHSSWITGSIHLVISASYSYLFYCERKLNSEWLGIHHTGITIPSLPEQKFLLWSNISQVKANYSSITIQTSIDKTYHFDLQTNLQFEELDQIHEFCRHYLGNEGG